MAISKRAGPPNGGEHIFPAAQRTCAVADTGHATSFSHPTAKRCTSPSVHARMFQIALQKPIAHASLSLIPTAPDKRFTRGGFVTLSGLRFAPAPTNSG